MSQQPDLNRFQSPFFFFSCDRRGSLTFISPSVREVLGYAPEQLVGTNYYDLLDSGHAANARVSRHSPPCGNEVCHVTRALRTTDGDSKVLSIQIYNERESNDESSLSHGIALDVTAQWEMSQILLERRNEVGYQEDELTDREKKVLDLLLGGALNKTMARELDVSERTIEMDRARLMKKLSANSAAQLVSIATEARLLNGALGHLQQSAFGESYGNHGQFCGGTLSSSRTSSDDK